MKKLNFRGFVSNARRLQTPRVARAATLATALLAPMPAVAADPVRRARGSTSAANGLPVRQRHGHVADPIGIQSAGGTTPYGTFYGGVHGGYEHHFASRLMLGVELDMSFADYSDLANVLSYRATATGTANEQLQYLSSLRGRAGYDMGSGLRS